MLLLLLLSTYNYISWHITLYFCLLFYLLGRVFALFVCYFTSRSAFSRFLFATLPPEVLRLGIHNRLSFLYPIFLHKLLILSLIFIHKSSFWVYVVVSIPHTHKTLHFPGMLSPQKRSIPKQHLFIRFSATFDLIFPLLWVQILLALRVYPNTIFLYTIYIFLIYFFAYTI